MLSSQLLNLKSAIDAYAPRPTMGQKERLNDLLAQWNLWKTEMERIISEDAGRFNETYKAAELPVLILPK
ncbi:MAG: hypothetical protein ACE5FF_14130 [Saprospiraceae bacterium]